MAQELIQTDFERGYAKDGQKVSVWQYFDSSKKPELVINHTSGKVMFVSKDTSDYSILKNGQWLDSKLEVHPVPIRGTVNFYEDLKYQLTYPEEDLKAGLQGKVLVLFEVDTLGNSVNYSLAKGIGGACDSAVLRCLRSIGQKWVPAIVKGKKYSTQFAIEIEFRPIENVASSAPGESVVKNAKLLTSIIVANDDRVYNFVESSAEFIGGMQALYTYIGRNLKYPAPARRMGVEGTVTIKFIIERDGAITNAEILRGFYEPCDSEALRLIQGMPRWKPGTQRGRSVRQSYVLPVRFRLSE